jgi:hypothetical protein
MEQVQPGFTFGHIELVQMLGILLTLLQKYQLQHCQVKHSIVWTCSLMDTLQLVQALVLFYFKTTYDIQIKKVGSGSPFLLPYPPSFLPSAD